LIGSYTYKYVSKKISIYFVLSFSSHDSHPKYN
jgi:hypothetical protein